MYVRVLEAFCIAEQNIKLQLEFSSRVLPRNFLKKLRLNYIYIAIYIYS